MIIVCSTVFSWNHIVTSNNFSLLSQLINKLNSEFVMKDVGDLHYFLGIEISKYVMDLLVKTKMLNSKAIGTPLAKKMIYNKNSGPLVDASEYQSIVGALQYIAFTRPDLIYAVNIVFQFMQQPIHGY